ncbi:MAG: DedA family protein [Minisyncoccia bacterium]
MLNLVISHAYLFLIPLAILEGPLLSIVCGVAAGLGYLDPFVAYGILVGGDLLPDIGYYSIGRFGATLPWVKRVATRTRLIRETLLPLEDLWREHLQLTLASAKLAYGVSPPFIVSAGLSKVPFWRFIGASLIVSCVYLGALGAAGYGLALVYGVAVIKSGQAPEYLGIAGFASLLILGLIMYQARRHLDPVRARRKSKIIHT